MSFKEYLTESPKRRKIWSMISKAEDDRQLSNLGDIIKQMKRDDDLKHFASYVEKLQSLSQQYDKNNNDNTYDEIQDVLDKIRMNLE